MSQMIYKPGGDTLVWGIKAQVKVVNAEERDAYLAEGWLDHPSQLFNTAEPEPEPDVKAPRGGRGKKAVPPDNAEAFV